MTYGEPGIWVGPGPRDPDDGGLFVTLPADEDEIRREIGCVYNDDGSPYTGEIDVLNTEGFEPLAVGEFDLGDLITLAQVLDDLGDEGGAYLAFLDESNRTHDDDALAAFHNSYRGEYNDAEDFGRAEVDGIYTLEPWIEQYIDYERLGDDLLNGDFRGVDNPYGGIYVFRIY